MPDAASDIIDLPLYWYVHEKNERKQRDLLEVLLVLA